jgi:hypothetical protein
MRTVTLSIEKVPQARVHKCNSPRLLDRQTGIFAMRSNKTVHAPIEVGELEAILIKEASNISLIPVSAMTGPLNEYGRAMRQHETNNFFKSFPQFPELSPMSFDFRDSGTAPMHIHIGPGRTPSTGAGEPKCRISAVQVLLTFIHGVN